MLVVVRDGPGCILVRCEPVEVGVRSLAVVDDPPVVDDPLRLSQAPEQRLVETFVPEPAVGALDKAILLRLIGLNVVPGNTRLQLPAQHRVRG